MRKGESIFKRKDGRYEARYIKGRDASGKSIYGYVYGHSYSEVKKKRAEALQSSEVNEEKKAEGGFLFEQQAAEWLKQKAQTAKASTIVKYSNVLNKWLYPYFTKVDITGISTQNIKSLLARLGEQGLSESYTKTILTVLKSIIAHSKAQGAVNNCIFEQFHINAENKKITVLSVVSQQKLTGFLLRSIDNTSICIMISLYIGLRIGEICALKWENINLEENTINVKHTLQRLSVEGGSRKTKLVISEPKSESGNRTVPIPDFLVQLLSQNRCKPECYLLSGTTFPIEPRVLQNRFKKILKNCNLPNVNFHTLRHTFATRSIECGVDVKTLSEILGHSSVKTTLDRYVHPTQEQKKNSVNKLANEIFLSSK